VQKNARRLVSFSKVLGIWATTARKVRGQASGEDSGTGVQGRGLSWGVLSKGRLDWRGGGGGLLRGGSREKDYGDNLGDGQISGPGRE